MSFEETARLKTAVGTRPFVRHLVHACGPSVSLVRSISSPVADCDSQAVQSAIQSKQKTLHSALAIWINAAVSAVMWVFCIALSGAVVTGPATAATSLAPSMGDQVAKLRLIAAPGLTNGRYVAGIEITMTPGSHTYWKQPGQAGVPPVFAFNGSTNVAKADVRFPAPSRIGEDGIEAFGYADRVVFPVDVTPTDPTKPSELKLVADYAVCNKICIPAHGAAALVLSPGGEGMDSAKVAAAVADVPSPISLADRKNLAIVPDNDGAKQAWTIVWSGSMPISDIFVDAPEGFYFDTKKDGHDRFKLIAVQALAAGMTTRVPISLTLARKAGNLVANETLELKTSTN